MRLRALGAAMLTLGAVATLLWVLATATLRSSASSIQTTGVDSTIAAPLPSVEASSAALYAGTTHRTVVKGTNFNTNTGTIKLFFDHPEGENFKFRVVSSTRIVLFVRFSSNPPDGRQPLKLVAIDTGAGAVQLNPEDGGVVIGTLISVPSRKSSGPFRHREVSPGQDDTPSVKASSTVIERSHTNLEVKGANFDLGYTELHFSPPLPEEAMEYYRVESSDTILLNLKHEKLEVGALRVVAIDAGGGLVPLNQENGGVVIAVIVPYLAFGRHTTVDENESLRIYQSTKQIQITGSGFQNSTKVLFKDGLCGGDTRSTLHTKLGEQPHQLTLELAEGKTWIDEDLEHNFPAPLELRSANAGTGWSDVSRTVAVVLQDPGIHASDTELYHGLPTYLTIRGTGFWLGSRKRASPSKSHKRGDRVYETVPPRLDFDPPIDPEFISGISVNLEREVWVSLKYPREDFNPEWAPPGYFGPLKVKGVDTGAGMVVLDPPVTVANIIPGSANDFFLRKRIDELRDGCTLGSHQDRADQAIREWEAMTLAERTQSVGALVPTPSVKPSSVEVYASQTERLVVEGDNFLLDTRLIFDPPLRDGSFWQQVGGFIDHGLDPRGVAPTRIDVERFMRDTEVSTWWRAAPGQLKVVAIENGAGVVELNPGVVVANVKADPKVYDNESLLIYQSTKELRIAGSGFDDDVEVGFWNQPVQERVAFTVVDVRTDELTLSLEGGSTWIKVATVFEDPAIQASSAKLVRGSTREFSVYGEGFNKVVKPILEFDPPLHAEAVTTHVVYRGMIRLTLSTTAAYWTRETGYLGPLKIKGVDTGAGMVVFAPPVTVATVQDVDTHDDEEPQVATQTNIETLPSVEASMGEIPPHRENSGFFVFGANFHPKSKLIFDSSLPEELGLKQTFISSTEIAITKAGSKEGAPPIPWRAEPGPIQIVGFDTEGFKVQLEQPVVVAVVREDVVVEENESLHVYQSAKEIRVNGGGFGDNISVTYLGGPQRCGSPPAGQLHIDIVSASQLTLSLEGESSLWVEESEKLPAALCVLLGTGVLFDEDDPSYGDGGSGVIVATVFEDPSINASDVEIARTGSRELAIWGTGFSNMTTPVIDFDPPLDSSNVDVKVVNRTMVQLSLENAQAGWVAAEQLGALKIQGVDTGAGMVVFDSPVTVATLVPDSELFFKQGMDIDIHALALDSPGTAGNVAESEPMDCSERASSAQVDNTLLPPPVVEASSTVIDMKATDSLVVNGDNFDSATRLIFDPPLDTGFEMRVFSRTEIDVFTKFPTVGVPIPWRAEPGLLKVVAVETGLSGLVRLNPEEGGVVVARVE